MFVTFVMLNVFFRICVSKRKFALLGIARVGQLLLTLFFFPFLSKEGKALGMDEGKREM